MAVTPGNWFTIVAVAVVFAGCAAPSVSSNLPAVPQSTTGGTSGSAGGNVASAAPTFNSFTGSLTSADNSGTTTEVFTGQVFVPNSAPSLASGTLKITLSGASGLPGPYSHTILTSEALASSAPASFGSDGFKVWGSSSVTSGLLNFQFQYTFPLGTAAPATDTFTPSVTPPTAPAVSGPAVSTPVTVWSQITVAANPVAANGTSMAGAWGGWSAAPGAANVTSTNFLKLTNTGQKATASVVIGFSSASFTGANANFTVPLNSNIQFAWATGTSSATPGSLTYNWGTTSSSGSVTVTFSALNQVIFIEYRIVKLPSVLVQQSYSAPYTATEV